MVIVSYVKWFVSFLSRSLSNMIWFSAALLVHVVPDMIVTMIFGFRPLVVDLLVMNAMQDVSHLEHKEVNTTYNFRFSYRPH